MDDYAVVLNAGSSSLKFCVFRRPRRSLAARSARPDRRHRHGARVFGKDGGRRVDRRPSAGPPTVRDGRTRSSFVATWLRDRYGGAHVVGVGHRVVHGGARYTGPDDRHARGPEGSA